MTDIVTDEIVLSDTEPDVTLLDMPDDETNPCCQNVQFLIILPLNFRALKWSQEGENSCAGGPNIDIQLGKRPKSVGWMVWTGRLFE